jgi:hypothetical protein
MTRTRLAAHGAVIRRCTWSVADLHGSGWSAAHSAPGQILRLQLDEARSTIGGLKVMFDGDRTSHSPWHTSILKPGLRAFASVESVATFDQEEAIHPSEPI